MSSSTSPASSEPRRSARKGNKKVRTGCVTCKIRKVKCDETKPFCIRCTKTGRKCDGYPLSPKTSQGRTSLSRSPPTSPAFEDDQERRAFDYYRSRSATALKGSVDVGFWSGLVLRLSACEPAVRHSILALSSLHEYTNLPDSEDAKKRANWAFALREYGKAMSVIRGWTPDGRDDPAAVPLLVCLLFVCIEFLADREAAAQMHICQGRKILSEIGDGGGPSTSPATDMIRLELVPIYTRLSLSSYTFGSRPSQIPQHLKISTSVPAEFSSRDESRQLLYQILDEGLEFSARGRAVIYSAEPDDVLEVGRLQVAQQRLLSQLVQWKVAFTIYTSRLSELHHDLDLAVSIDLLLVYYNTAFVWISTALQPLETAYDSYTASFSSIISLSASILHVRRTCGQNQDAFGFESELIPPLYWTATKCRHPLLRREAMRLVMAEEVRGKRENLWDAVEAAAVAARVIEMEEGGQEMALQGNVPADGQSGLPDGEGVRVPLSEYPSVAPLRYPDIDGALSLLTLSDEASLADAAGSMLEPSSSHQWLHEPMRPSQPPVRTEPGLALSVPGFADFDPPYGIPEKRRVKNALFGPKQDKGIWLTLFMEPKEGETEWKITNEFLQLRL